MALAQLQEIRRKGLATRAGLVGPRLMKMLHTLEAPPGLKLDVRGMGLLAGVELSSATGQPATKTVLRVIKEMLEAGYILLPEGADANVISFTPPLTIGERQLYRAVNCLKLFLANGIESEGKALRRKKARATR
jgi:4-aminobutyrate aminotransferase-like enzyme